MSFDKMMGAWMGAAIGDAMGGPVECQHYLSIKNRAGYVDTLLPYTKDYSIMDLHPGYALHEDAGSITDDTFIRVDIANYLLNVKPPWNSKTLCDYLLSNADFSYWWDPAIKALNRVKDGTPIVEVGETHLQGGGNGWWYPVAMMYPGNPTAAAKLVRELSSPWKSGLEKDLLGALIGTMAYALGEDATYDGAIDTMYSLMEGPLSKKLIDRAIAIGESEEDFYAMAEKIYDNILIFDEPTRDMNGEMPKVIPGSFTDSNYISVYFVEQMPLMMAGFAYGKGLANSICATVSLGRDCDSTATAVGFIVGALNGESGLPKDWVETVQSSNSIEFDLKDIGRKLIELSETI